MTRALDALGLVFLAAVWLVAYCVACPAAELGALPLGSLRDWLPLYVLICAGIIAAFIVVCIWIEDRRT